ncbi:MAG: DoxX family membrane protein [Candidatus Paceibacterota bacterium]
MRKKFLTLLSIFTAFLPLKAFAHIRYLVEENDFTGQLGGDKQFLMEVFNSPHNMVLILSTVAVAALLFIIAQVIPFCKQEISTIREKADNYVEFIPWILRLSLGIALIGAGTGGWLISPAFPGYTYLGLIQILLGFFMLAGLLIAPVILITILLYVFALTKDFYAIGNFEVLAAAVALLFLNHKRPGVDDLLNIPNITTALQRFRSIIPLILRVGIGGAMVFLGIYEKMLNPHVTEMVIKNFGLMNVVPVDVHMWVFATGIIEVVLGTALILGLRTRLVTAVTFIVLTLSFFYFGEEVSSHVTLFGVLSALFITRGGRFSLDNRFEMVNPHFAQN